MFSAGMQIQRQRQRQRQGKRDRDRDGDRDRDKDRHTDRQVAGSLVFLFGEENLPGTGQNLLQ